MADILSVVSATGEGIEALMYRLEGGVTPLEIWGHQYIKRLSSDIIHVQKSEQKIASQKMTKVIAEVIECLFRFNSECDAIDLLIEIGILNLLPEYADTDNTDRITTYLSALVPYLEAKEREKAENALIEIYQKENKIQSYVTLMIRRNYIEKLIKELNESPKHIQQQMAYEIAKHGVYGVWRDVKNKQIKEIIQNKHMKRMIRHVAEKMELLQEKTWGYGALGEGLAKATFTEETIPEQEKKSAYRITSQCAKGLLYLWDPETAMQKVEGNLFAEDGYVKVANILALSLSGCRMQDENETVLAIARESFDTNSITQRLVLIQAIVLQYAGSARSDVFGLMQRLMHVDHEEVRLFAVYAAGAILAGTCNVEVFTEMIQVISEYPSTSAMVRYALLGISLLFLGGEEKVERVIDTAESIEGHEKDLPILLRSLAYFGTGNTQVLKSMLTSSLDESSPEGSEEEEQRNTQNENKHAFSAIGIALVSAGEETLVQMATHVLEGALLLDMPGVQSAVPLALGLLHMSTAKIEVIETLKRCSHSGDIAVIISSLAALGVVAAGSNNSRVQNALEQMGSFCTKGTPGSMLNIAEGLLHMGKGTLRLSLFVDGVVCKKAVSCMLGFVFSLIGGGTKIIDRYHFMISLLAPAIMPKFIVAVNETGEIVDARVRVGTRIDVSGVAGRPKRISGSVFHALSILLQANDAADII